MLHSMIIYRIQNVFVFKISLFSRGNAIFHGLFVLFLLCFSFIFFYFFSVLSAPPQPILAVVACVHVCLKSIRNCHQTKTRHQSLEIQLVSELTSFVTRAQQARSQRSRAFCHQAYCDRIAKWTIAVLLCMLCLFPGSSAAVKQTSDLFCSSYGEEAFWTTVDSHFFGRSWEFRHYNSW